MASNGPVEAAPDVEVTSISNGNSHSAAILSNGMVLTWGRGEDGQLGLGDAEERSTPTSLPSMETAGATSVACGAEYTLALVGSRGDVYSWGWGDFGRLGHGDCSDVFLPRQISAFTGIRIVRIAGGDTHSLVVSDTGALYTFGRNANGQLGNGSTDDSPSPVLVTALEGKPVVSIAAGAEHSVVAVESGEVYAWGWGRYGNVGDGDRADRYLPTQARGDLEGRKCLAVACGWRHSMVVDSEGCVFTWGWGSYGQLGLNGKTDVLIPSRVSGLMEGRTVVSIAGGWRHSVAVDTAGSLYAWGWNKFGQLGVGKGEDRQVPVAVASLAEEPITLAACGWRHTTVVSVLGNVYSWGRGCCGQLGHGDLDDLSEPRQLTLISKGSVDLKALRLVGSELEAAAYVAPSDRYAVVPQASGQNGSAAVPQAPEPKRQKT